MTTNIDTLRIYERLRKASLEDSAAKEIASVFKETVEDQLATKADLERVKMELESSIAQSKAETVKWVAGMLVAQAAIIAGLVKLL